MIQEFEIMQVFNHHNRGQFIFARQIKAGQDFDIKEGSLLGGVPIYQYLDMPRILDDNGQPRLDVFVFKPLINLPTANFQVGQIVELILPE
ncbi:MAG: hypothetical protein IPG86_10235 [Chitinophagaceae bacterium]|nr:hypothetical protein [Chitinophagaceae bacterium]